MGGQQTNTHQGLTYPETYKTAKVIQLKPKQSEKLNQSELKKYMMLGVQESFLDRVRNIIMGKTKELEAKVQYEINCVRDHYAKLMCSGSFYEASTSAYQIISLFNSKTGGINWENKYKKEFREKAKIAAELAKNKPRNK